MDKFEFTLLLSGVPELTQELECRIFDAGCDDALLGWQNGVVFLDFIREAETAEDAILSAIRDVKSAGCETTRVAPDEFVSASEIAARVSRSRQNILQFWTGQRGPGGFPPPVSDVKSKRPKWRWTEVAPWFVGHGLVMNDQVLKATAIARVNLALDWHRLERMLPSQRTGALKEILRSSGAKNARGRSRKKPVVKRKK